MRVLAIRTTCGESRVSGAIVAFESCHGVSLAKSSQILSPASNSAQVRCDALPPCDLMAPLPEVQGIISQLSIKTHLVWQEGGRAVMHFTYVYVWKRIKSLYSAI